MMMKYEQQKNMEKKYLLLMLCILAGCKTQNLDSVVSQNPPIPKLPEGYKEKVRAQADVNTANVSLAWDASPDNSVTGYKLYAGELSRNYNIVINVGNTLTGTFTNLQREVTYYFAATAYNILGTESVYSDELVYTIPQAPIVPQVLTLITVASTNLSGPWMPISTNTVSSTNRFELFKLKVNKQP